MSTSLVKVAAVGGVSGRTCALSPSLLLLCLFHSFSFCTVDVNTKEQESVVRKRPDDRNEDEGQEEEKKDKWQWWTRFQV